VAFSHLCFNVFGILIFYPLKMLPIGLAEYIGENASKSRKNLIIFIVSFLMIYIIPLLIIIFT
jgi:sodium-dependent phosphate cotransporter